MANLPLRVLGDRILVRPDVHANTPSQTESGLYTATSLAAAVTGDDPTTSLHRGTVLAVGNPRHPLHQEAESLADRVHLRFDGEFDHTMRDVEHMLRDLVRRQSSVSVGDDVLFSHDAGQELTLDGETFVILHDADLIAVVLPEESHV